MTDADAGAVSDETLVYLEDYGRAIGIYPYPAKLAKPIDPVLEQGLVKVPREQAERWARVEAAWEAAQAEMRMVLKARREQVLTALAGVAGFESASRAARRAAPRRGRQQ